MQMYSDTACVCMPHATWTRCSTWSANSNKNTRWFVCVGGLGVCGFVYRLVDIGEAVGYQTDGLSSWLFLSRPSISYSAESCFYSELRVHTQSHTLLCFPRKYLGPEILYFMLCPIALVLDRRVRTSTRRTPRMAGKLVGFLCLSLGHSQGYITARMNPCLPHDLASQSMALFMTANSPFLISLLYKSKRSFRATPSFSGPLQYYSEYRALGPFLASL